MKLLVASECGEGLGLATHLSSEGHAVNFLCQPEFSLGQGIVSSNPTDTAADIFVFDSSMFTTQADSMRSSGTRVLGASSWEGLLSSNTEYANDIIKVTGWETTDSCKGINLYITVWFNGMNHIAVYTSLVYRRFMSGGRGPDVNFTGVVSQFRQPTDRLLSTFIQPLMPVLRRVNHRGCFNIHALIAEEKASVKHINASFSHPLSLMLYENSRSSVSDILVRLFAEDSKPIAFIDPWAAGVMVSVPPFPYDVASTETNLRGIQPANLKHLWLVDAKKDNGTWTTAGLHGKIGYVTARGCSVSEATRRVYRTIRNLEIRDLQYRDDVGRNIHDILSTLQRNGWTR